MYIFQGMKYATEVSLILKEILTFNIALMQSRDITCSLLCLQCLALDVGHRRSSKMERDEQRL